MAYEPKPGGKVALLLERLRTEPNRVWSKEEVGKKRLISWSAAA